MRLHCTRHASIVSAERFRVDRRIRRVENFVFSRRVESGHRGRPWRFSASRLQDRSRSRKRAASTGPGQNGSPTATRTHHHRARIDSPARTARCQRRHPTHEHTTRPHQPDGLAHSVGSCPVAPDQQHPPVPPFRQPDQPDREPIPGTVRRRQRLDVRQQARPSRTEPAVVRVSPSRPGLARPTAQVLEQALGFGTCHKSNSQRVGPSAHPRTAGLN